MATAPLHGFKRSRLIALFSIAILAVVGYLAASRLRSALVSRQPAAAPAQQPAPTAAATRAPAQTVEPAPSPAAPVHHSDLEDRFAALSPRAGWAAWLGATRDLVESAAVLIENLAEDEDPRRRLAPLLPGAAFAVTGTEGHFVESMASGQRFDGAVDILCSIDAKKAAQLWRSLHPLLDVSYRTVGRPGVSLDEAAGRALERIETAPVADAPLPLEAAGRLWLYADASLEQLGPVEKLLLRLGIENERKLQSKARELQAAMAIPWTAQ